ncbi:hypothetical protein V5799_002224 [Amblyomma americanum]|uniref:Secreted protein n=1 Tax=Amblyomma americanum TaxID=6943 RepID=A0AAQ4CXY4_AMBAM
MARSLCLFALCALVVGTRAMDLKSMGIDLERASSLLLPMLPVICNANKEQKQNVDCAGCMDAIVQYIKAVSNGEEWAILSADGVVSAPRTSTSSNSWPRRTGPVTPARREPSGGSVPSRQLADNAASPEVSNAASPEGALVPEGALPPGFGSRKRQPGPIVSRRSRRRRLHSSSLTTLSDREAALKSSDLSEQLRPFQRACDRAEDHNLPTQTWVRPATATGTP